LATTSTYTGEHRHSRLLHHASVVAVARVVAIGVAVAIVGVVAVAAVAIASVAGVGIVIISVALAAGVNPLPPAIGATLGASWGFMLPVSTPPNAIVYGSGLVPITKMIRAGFLFDVFGGLILLTLASTNAGSTSCPCTRP
jgi:sodium-dependent dicarboxylate transporter 2/3/5